MEETKTKELPKRNNEKELTSEYDKGWSWFVLFGAFVILSTFGCFMYSRNWNFEKYGLIRVTSKFEIYAEVIISIFIVICYVIAPLSSMLIKLFGFRIVTVVGSILGGISTLVFYFDHISSYSHGSLEFYKNLSITLGIGIGLGLMYFSAITSVITYFKKFRPLAIGIAVCGLSEVTFFYKLNEFVKDFGNREGFIILTILIFLCALCGFIFRPLQVTKKTNTQNETENPQVIINENTKSGKNDISKRFKEWSSDMISLFKNPVFIFFVVLLTFLSIAQHMAFNYFIFYLREITRSQEFEFYLYAIALSGLLGRILFGLIFSIPQLTQHRHKIFSVAILVSGIAPALIIPWNDILGIIIIFISMRGSIGMIPVIVADLMTPKLFSNAFSLLLFFSGITMLFEYNIIYLMDNMANRMETPLIIFGSIISLCGILLLSIPTLQSIQEKRRVNNIYLERL